MLKRLKKARQEYRNYKISSRDEGFIEWYLKRFAKDLTKFALSLTLLGASTWLIYDLSRVIILFKIVILASLLLLILEYITRKR